MIAADSAEGSRATSRPRPLLAHLLSLLAPGAGHVYAGRPGKGVALWLAGSAVAWLGLAGGAFSTFSGMIVMLAVLVGYWLWVSVSAMVEARRARGATLGKGRWYVLAGLLVVQLAASTLPTRSLLPVRSFRVPSASMAPAIRPGDHLIADMRVWNRRRPRRGDLVIYHQPRRPQEMSVKRVIGLPGETVELRDRRLYVDGRPVEDPWARYSDEGSPYLPQVTGRDRFGPSAVPEGSLFVLGDNRDNSFDSRAHGPIASSLLVGEPLYVYWSRDRDRIGRSLAVR